MKTFLLLITLLSAFVLDAFAMEVHVRMPSETTHTFTVEQSDLIESLKEQIESRLVIPVANQELRFNGNILGNHLTFADYNIQNGATLDLSMVNVDSALGQHWAAASATEPNFWASVTYGNGKFVAISSDGNNRVMYSEDGVSWTAATAAQANDWRSVAYGNGKFVAVALDGTNRVMHSDDGVSWTAANAPGTYTWNAVTYANGKFVAVGNSHMGSTNAVMHSENGVSWTASSIAPSNWRSVTYGDGKYVAIASAGFHRAAHSDDGITWTTAAVPETNQWRSVTYGNGKFVAVTQSGNSRVMYSEDGITWTAAEATEANEWLSVTYGDGKFLAVAQNGENRVIYSEDGISWTAAEATEANSWQSVTYGDGKFLAVASDGDNRVMHTTDAPPPITVTSITPEANETNIAANATIAITFSEDIDAATVTTANITVRGQQSGTLAGSWSVNGATATFSPTENFAAGEVIHVEASTAVQSTGGGQLTSSFASSFTAAPADNETLGQHWAAASAAEDNSWVSIAYGKPEGTDGLFVAVSASGTGNRVMTSPDGITWTSQTSAANNNWSSVTYGNGLFVAVSSNGTGNRVMTSPDGITWTSRTSAANNSWQSVTYGNGLFVAVARTGTGNRVMTSPDGIDWTIQASAEDNDWLSVTYGNGLFVAVSMSGTGDRVMTSPDGVTWTSQTSAEDNNWFSVTYGKGLFVAVSATGSNNRVMTSPDGITWTSQTHALNNGWRSVTYGNGLFVAISGSGIGNRVMTSPDGINWATQTSAADNGWTSVTYGNGKFVAVSINNDNRVMHTIPPPPFSVSSITPASNATNIAADATIALTFSEDVDAATVTTANIKVRGQQSGTLAGSWSVTGAEATFTPTEEFVAGEVIHVEASTAVQSTGGGSLTSSFATSFTAAPADNETLAQHWAAASASEQNNWLSVTYGKGKFVAVSSDGTNRVMHSEDGVSWTAAETQEDNAWQSVTYGNGRFVAVANDGGAAVMYSEDGITWIPTAPAMSIPWTSVTYGNGKFVAVANNGINRVMYSEDGGEFWTAAENAEYKAWNSVTYGNGKFVAVASDLFNTNTVMYSEDGITWTAAVASNGGNWQSVTYGNGKFVAVANSGANVNRAMHSEDGITWTGAPVSEANNWKSVTYGDGKFVAVSSNGTNRIIHSEDGATWTATGATEGNQWNSVAYGNGKFVSVSSNGDNRVMHTTAPPITVTSVTPAANATNIATDATIALTFSDDVDEATVTTANITVRGQQSGTLAGTWSVTGAEATFTPTENFVAGEVIHVEASTAVQSAGGGKLTSSFATSFTIAPAGNETLGQHWAAVSAAEQNNWSSVTYGNGKYVAVASGGDNRVMYSEDGVTWTAVQVAADNSWSSVTYGNPEGTGGLFVAVSTSGEGNRVMTSSDGITWTSQTSAADNSWTSVTYGNGKYVAVSLNGDHRVMHSEDGETWTAVQAAEDNFWSSVTYGNGRFVAIAQSADKGVMHSEDGETWTVEEATEPINWKSVTYGNGKYVAVGFAQINDESGLTIEGRVMHSADGKTWTAATPAQNNSWEAVTYGNGKFIAVANSGANVNRVMYSEDGETWTAASATEQNGWNSVTYGNGKFVSVSSNGDNRVMHTTAPPITVTSVTPAANATNIATDATIALTFSDDVDEATVTTANITVRGQQSGTLAGSWSVNGAEATFTPTENFVAGEVIHVEASSAVQSTGGGQLTGFATSFTAAPAGNEILGQHWAAASAAEDNAWRSVAYGNGKYVAVASGGDNRVMHSEDGETWTAVQAAEDNSWQSVTYGNDLFVAVSTSGEGNRVMTSSDGITWTSQISAEDNFWQSVTYGNGKYVAVSSDGNNRVMHSEDGETWTAVQAAEDNFWQSVTYGNGKFVAVSFDGSNRVMYSEDGETWTATQASGISEWKSVTYGNGRFVAVASDRFSGNHAMYSTDGETWTASTKTEFGLWQSVTYGNGKFMAVSVTGPNYVLYSEDGDTWTAAPANDISVLQSVTYGNGKFVAVAATGINRVMYTTAPPITVTSVTPAANATNIAADATIALTFSGDVDEATVTTANITVRGQQSGTLAGTWSVTGAEATFTPTEEFVAGEVIHVEASSAVQSTGGGQLTSYATSFTAVPADNETLGQHWAASSAAEANSWQSVAYSDGKFVAVSNNGDNRVMYSEDGVNWTAANAAEDNAWQSVTYGDPEGTGGKFVAVASDGDNRVMYSEDGETWTAVQAAEDNSWSSVTYGNGKFVAVSTNGDNRVMHSEDGVNWSAASAASVYQWRSVTYGNGKFVAVASNVMNTDIVMYSEDGVTWTAAEASNGNSWHSVTYGNGKFVAVSLGGANENRAMHSEDGITWTGAPVLEQSNWNSVAYGNGKFVAVSFSGFGSRVMYSEDGASWSFVSETEAGQWTSVAYGNDKFVAVSAFGENRVMYTTVPPLTVSSSTPEHNATKVSLTDSVVVKFSQEITLVDASSILFNDGSDDIVPEFVRVREDSLIVGPNGFTNGVTYTLTIGEGAVEDDFEQLNEEASIGFRTIKTAPVMVNVFPANKSVQIPADSVMSVAFDQEISLAIAKSASVTINGTTTDDFEVSLSENSVIIGSLESLEIEFEEGADVSVTLAAGAVSNDDDLESEEIIWSWRVFRSFPTIVSSTPENNATRVSLTDSVVVKFSQDITLVDASSILFNDGSDDIVPEFVRVREDSLIVGPNGFTNGVTYTLTIGAGAVEDENQQPNEEEIINFRTIKTAPFVVNLFPANKSVQIPADSVMSVAFDQEVSLVNVKPASVTVNGTTTDDFDVSLFENSVIIGSLESLEIDHEEGAEVSVTLAVGAVSNDDDLVSEEIVWTWRVFKPAPTLVSSTPANNAIKVSLTDSLVLKYDVAISLVDEAKIFFNDGSEDITPEFIRVREDSLIVGPNGFTNGVTYTLTIGAGAVQDENEQPNEEESISFRTIIAAPAPLVFFPDDGSVLVPLNTDISVKFNKLVQEYSKESSITADVIVNETRFSEQAVTLKDSTATVTFDNSNFVENASVTVEFNAEGAFIANEDDVLIEPFSWSFTMFIEAPPQAVLSVPANDSVNVPLQPTLVWIPADRAESYELEFADNTDWTDSEIFEIEEGTSYEFTEDLERNQTYNWRVRGVNSGGKGKWSDTWNFTTELPLPAQVTGLIPEDGQGSVSVLAELNWDGVEYAKSYDLQYKFEVDQNFITVNNLTTTDYLFEDSLAYYQSVFWQVRGVNATGAGAWSTLNEFITEAAQPLLGFPFQEAIGISIAPRMQWSSIYTETTFQVMIAIDDEFTQVAVDSLVSEQLLFLVGLESDQEYYWQVRVNDEITSSQWSEMGRFRTRPAPGSVAAGEENEVAHDFGGVQNTQAPQQTEYRLLSIPGNQEIEVSELFEGEMGKDWIAWYDDGSDEDFFVEYDQDDSNFRFRAGNGFWVMSLPVRAYEMEYKSIAVNNRDNYPVQLRSGWNVISNPFNTEIPWQQVQFINDITTPIYGYDGSYHISENFTPFQAYYFYNDPTNPLQALDVPYVSAGDRGLDDNVLLERLPSSEMARVSMSVQLSSGVQRFDQQVNLLFPENTDSYYKQAMPRSQRGQVGMSLLRDNSKRTGWREISEIYDYRGVAFELEISGKVSDKLIWTADLHELPEQARVLLIHPITLESYLLADGESAQALISSPSVIYTMYVGDQAYLQEIQDNLLPNEITLEPNYPNPFNPVTNIRYALPVEQQVRFEVFDVLGRRVQILESGIQPAGWHLVQFDGSRLASGMYIYRLHTADQIKTGKMMLVK